VASYKEQNEEGRPPVAGLSQYNADCNADVLRRCFATDGGKAPWWSIENSGGGRKVHRVAADQRSRPPGRRAYGRARKSGARNPPIDPNHRVRCLGFGLQVHARRGQGRTAKANRDTHRHAGWPVETRWGRSSLSAGVRGHNSGHISRGGAALWRPPDRSEAMACPLNTSVA